MHTHHHHARSPHAHSDFNPVVAPATLIPRAIVHTHYNHPEFIFHLNLFIIFVVVIFVLCGLPRFFFRFSHPDEWRNGHFLRSKPVNGEIQLTSPTVLSPSPGSDDENEKYLSPLEPAYFSPTGLPEKQAQMHSPISLDEHFTSAINLYDESDNRVLKDPFSSSLTRNNTTTSTTNLLSRSASTATTASTRISRRREGLPSHMPSFAARIPYATPILRYTLRPGLDVGKALVLICYFSILLYGTFYKSNVFSNAIRTGYLAVSQIPVVVILGTKNNFIGMLLGKGYERLNLYHRYAGLLLVLCCNVHTLGYFYEWALEGTVAENMALPKNARATFGLVCIDMLAFFSTSFWRNRYYNVFLVTHVIAVVGVVSSICMHSSGPGVAPYVYISIGIYAVDRVTRGFRTKYTTARITPIPDMGMTRVEIPSINAGWRAGQHIRLQVLSRGMGTMGWAEVHPFTIASVSQSEDGSGLTLMCKKSGTWTKKLYELAQKPAPISSESAHTRGKGGVLDASPTVKVLVEGPYGGPGHTMFCSFSGAMFVCGGSGITFALSAIQDLVQKDLVGESRLKTIDLVWSIPDPTGLTLEAGRPKLATVLSGVLDRATTLSFQGKGSAGWKKSEGVVVGVCGPLSLADQVRNVVRSVDRKRMKAAGGIEIHEEVFGW
ncbi:hypothetical protein EIP91_009935 [Steccherinum ochraceum]|uniref:ferric-chelate reductase (NADPH) n=1 Tax=Steccherinum ochraceum TaxID=92696 RepID=A0A4V2MV00_9APHY|nr:hypothetical protein EIP91_009935 [Steccherinum ochraceum]